MVEATVADRVDLGYGPTPGNLYEFVMGAQHHLRVMRADCDPDYRMGQAFFNYGDCHFPEGMMDIVATPADPFHNDGAVNAMLQALVAGGWIKE